MDAVLALVQGSPALRTALDSVGASSPGAVMGTLVFALLASLLVLRSALGLLLRPRNLPPTVACLPFVGGFLKFVKGPLPLMEAAFKAHGCVFTVPLFHKRVTFLIGPEVSPHFYKARAGAPAAATQRTRRGTGGRSEPWSPQTRTNAPTRLPALPPALAYGYAAHSCPATAACSAPLAGLRSGRRRRRSRLHSPAPMRCAGHGRADEPEGGVRVQRAHLRQGRGV